jgi:hypothetical protein
MHCDNILLLNCPLKGDHPSYKATFSMKKMWPYKRGDYCPSFSVTTGDILSRKWVNIPVTLFIIFIHSTLSDICDRSMVFSRFLHQLN